MSKVLVFHGGWQGHQPRQFAAWTAEALTQQGAKVDVHDTLDVLDDPVTLTQYDLIVPIWTMGELSGARERNLMRAVEAGTGLAGWHGGMGDAFRASLEYKMMVGGQFVAHPGDIRTYTVNISGQDDPITRGVADFEITSEQYYLHVDPGNEVIATTTFDGDVMPWLAGMVMPVAWKRSWGRGRVFYLALGHAVAEFDIPEVRTLATRGMAWAARTEGFA